MPSTAACFGNGWWFDGSGKPALKTNLASGPFGFDGSGNLTLGLDPANTHLNGFGQVGDILHYAATSGTGDWAPAVAYGVLGTSLSTISGGTFGYYPLNTSQSFAGITFVNPFSTTAIVTMTAGFDGYLGADTVAAAEAAVVLNVDMPGTGGTEQSVHILVAASINPGSNGVMMNNSYQYQANYVIAAGATVHPKFRLIYNPRLSDAEWFKSGSVSASWQIHRV